MVFFFKDLNLATFGESNGFARMRFPIVNPWVFGSEFVGLLICAWDFVDFWSTRATFVMGFCVLCVVLEEGE